jgi:ubiquinone/menaquinone biosynthesis C-methylase UbiE
MELSPLRRFLKLFHPEGIPGPAASIYNAISSVDIFQRNYEHVAKHVMNHCSQGSLLDVGTGPGWLLIALHRLNPGMTLAGLDVSEAMVTKARNNLARVGLANDVEIHIANVIQTPFEDDAFDVVVSTGSIHHWKDPMHGLDEIYRVLKPRGYALIYDIVSDTPRSILTETRREFGKLKLLLFWLHGFEEPFYSQAAFEAFAQSTRFEKGQISYVGVLCCLTMQKA